MCKILRLELSHIYFYIMSLIIKSMNFNFNLRIKSDNLTKMMNQYKFVMNSNIIHQNNMMEVISVIKIFEVLYQFIANVEGVHNHKTQ